MNKYENFTMRFSVSYLSIFVIIFIISNVFNLWGSYERKISEVKNEASNLSTALARQAEDTFISVDVTLNDIASNINTIGCLSCHVSELSKILNERHSRIAQISDIYLLDADGNVITSSKRNDANLELADEREFFTWQKNNVSSDIFIGKVILGKISQKFVVPVSLRLSDKNGNFRGVILATIDIEHFDKFYSYFNVLQDTVLSLLNTNGKAIYIFPNYENFINKDLSTGGIFASIAHSGNSGVGIWRTTLDRRIRIIGYSRVKRYPLVVSVGFDKIVVQKEWLKENLLTLSWNAIFIIFIIMIMINLLGKINKINKNNKEAEKMNIEITEKNRLLTELVYRDPLTKLYNRRKFDEFLDAYFSNGFVSDISLIMIDVDYFKHYNDHYGHILGDKCLQEISEEFLKIGLQNDALIARLGGEEFAIILPDTTEFVARHLGERIVSLIRNKGIPHVKSLLVSRVITVSVGVCTIRDARYRDLTRLKNGADEALYQAKNQGRNRCVYLA